MKKRIIIIILALLIGVMPIVFNEVKNKDKYSLARDGKRIYRNVLRYVENNNISYEEILIKDGSFKLGDDVYKVEGNGHIFIDDTISFMLSRNNMCVLKLDILKEVSIQDFECDTYRMFNGIKENIVTSGNGLFFENDKYVYKGKSNNYIIYEDQLCNIVSFDNDKMIISCDNEEYSFDNNTIVKKGSGSLNDPYIIE